MIFRGTSGWCCSAVRCVLDTEFSDLVDDYKTSLHTVSSVFLYRLIVSSWENFPVMIVQLCKSWGVAWFTLIFY